MTDVAPLRRPAFRLLIIGELVSNLGDAIYSVALPWYVLSQHGGALLLGTVLTAYGIPRTALLIAGGHASDRFKPWTVMLVANVVRGPAVAALAVTTAAGLTHGAILIAIAIVLGAAEGMFIPASEAIVPALVSTDALQSGNSLSFGTTQLSQLAGPALGGALVAAFGASTGFAIDAATFVISALTLIGIRREAHQAASATPRSAPADRGDRTVTVRSLLATEPVLKLILLTDALLNLGAAGLSRVALPALAKGPLHLGAGGYGALSAAIGAGLLLGTLSGAWMPPAHRPLLITSLALTLAVPLIAAIPYVGGALPTAIVLVPAFALIAIGNLLFITGLQRWAPAHLLGRLTGLLMLASAGMFPVSVLLAGIVIGVTGPAAYFPLAAGAVLVAVAIQLTSPAWRRFSS